MKARSKKERKIAELSATLPELRKSDIDWIERKFEDNKRKGLYYFVILERCKEYQVIRYYLKSNFRLMEVMQIWLGKGEEYVIARQRFMRVDGWATNSDFSFRHINEYACYSYLGDMRYLPYSYAKIRSVIPELKRAGLKTTLHGLHPYFLCRALMENNRIETLFKLRQYELVFEFYSRFSRHSIDDMWQEIRIALRHGYHWDDTKEISDWCDMVSDLKALGLDTHNPHYICPANLHDAHQHWIAARHKQNEVQRLEQELRTIADYEPVFKATREQFFDMVITDGEIDIRVIPTAKAIKEEGIAMHHCVDNYYNQPKSLILSAKIDGKRIETIEVNLGSYRLIQSRGLQNCETPYHKRIVDLVNANLDLIRVLNVNHKAKERKELERIKKAA